MTSTVCILNVFLSEVTRAPTNLRSEINDFLAEQKQCSILGSGGSCTELGYFDLEIGFDSEKSAALIVRELKSSFANRCDLDVDWI